jgi:hypothetical protein
MVFTDDGQPESLTLLLSRRVLAVTSNFKSAQNIQEEFVSEI